MPLKPRNVLPSSRAPLITPPGPGPGFVSFQASGGTFSEVDGSVSVSVERTGGAAGVVEIFVTNQASGTATSSDFSYDKTSIEFASGAGGPFNVVASLIDRSGTQGARTLILALTSASGGVAIQEPSKYTLTIIDATATASGEVLTEGSGSNFFIRTGGQGTQNGLSHANAFSFSDATGRSFAAGERCWFFGGDDFTGAVFSNSTLRGTSSASMCIIGAYYRSGSENIRGLVSVDAQRPIIAGTSAWGDHDGNGLVSRGNMVPGDWGGLFQLDSANNFVRVENLEVKHSGGTGIRADDCNNIQVFNCYSHEHYRGGIYANHASTVLFDSNWIRGCNFAWKHYSDGSFNSTLQASETDDYIFRNNYIWQSWGECVGNWFKNSQFLHEKNRILEAGHAAFYIDSSFDGVIRENTVIGTGRTNWWRSGSSRMPGIIFANESGWYPPNDSLDPDTQRVRDIAIYANVVVGCDGGIQFWSEGKTQDEFGSVAIYGNQLLENGNNFSFSGPHKSGDFTGTKYYSNLSQATLTSTSDAGSTNFGELDASANFWSEGSAGGDLDGGADVYVGVSVTGTGLRDLNTIFSASTSTDGTLNVKQVRDFFAHLSANNFFETVPGGAASAGIAIASRTIPDTVTKASGVASTDYFGVTYTGPDIGAFTSV